MSVPSASYSVTMRVELDNAAAIGAVTTAVGDAGGAVTALDVVEPNGSRMVIDLTCNAMNDEHSSLLRTAVEDVEGAHVLAMSDRTFLLHLGGTISVEPKVSLKTRDDLSMAYTPGVARISMAIANDPSVARNLTIKRNTVAVVTDGSAVLGLGNIGPAAALPVMEGKALLFKRFAGVDAWPVCLATQDVDEIVRIVECIAPVYGGINLEDISAPRCFEIESRLREALDIPVFHDDQHGTATVVFAALLERAPRGRQGDEGHPRRGPRSGGRRSGHREAAPGRRRRGRHRGQPERDPVRRRRQRSTNLAAGWPPSTNAENAGLAASPTLCRGADVLIGVSGPDLVTEEHLKALASDSIVFALANPDPEVDPVLARRYAAIVATGGRTSRTRSTMCSPSPGSSAACSTSARQRSQRRSRSPPVRAIADVVTASELSPTYIVPTVFNPAVVPAVSSAVERVARSSQHA